MVCTLATPAWAADNAMQQPSATEAATAQLDFDIPALPLDEALGRYAAQSRRSTLFRSATVQGRISSAVRGRHSPESALRLLLEGTGLVAERPEEGPAEAFVLKEATAPAPPPVLGNAPAADEDDDGYDARLQARVWAALCANPRTAPGSYRSLLRFEVDAAGSILRPRLLGSSGDGGRDAALLDTLRGVRMDQPPPAAMPQPLTMIVLPRTRRDAPYCNAAR
ncbi:TonB C-terminal domain-containing protein [Variovorax sp.]|jgi:TonB family protein|uniref:TonB C-terminal domain-containing protein n=1 Tax=Variovorax sp. TaxID=1871043 RepID=UPI0037D99A09